jgi:hypothetical protein
LERRRDATGGLVQNLCPGFVPLSVLILCDRYKGLGTLTAIARREAELRCNALAG